MTALLLLVLVACNGGPEDSTFVDGDGDGFPAGLDCNDDDDAVAPGADERCNGVDDNCDGRTDEDEAIDAVAWHPDADGDGFGGDLVRTACEQPLGYVLDESDCDDQDPWSHPGGIEVCGDNADNDCDTFVDEDDAADAGLWFRDADADGFGDPAVSTRACLLPVGYAANALDCDDTDGSVHPLATEIWYDGVDQDCDGESDWDQDRDEWVEALDCDDLDPGSHPFAPEVCDGDDNDCDGETDEADAIDPTAWFLDFDGDGWGGYTAPVIQCDPPSAAYVLQGGDCADGNPAVNPGIAEVCNGLDDDCDTLTDEPDATDAASWALDFDGDGHGNPAQVRLGCTQPPGHVALDDDCDDGDLTVYPGAPELCDGLDNDCDPTGEVDEDPTGAPVFYDDFDGDGYGNPLAPTQACTQPPGHVGNADDCDDTTNLISPADIELCGDGVDNDCDEEIDEPDAPGSITWYWDPDGDGYGNLPTTDACAQPAGFAALGGDCDQVGPARVTVYPGAPELCDGRDNDCDLGIDEDPVDATTYYLDNDGDGWGIAVSIEVCELYPGWEPDGFAAAGGDCNDLEPAIHPGAPEVCDGEDNDCANGPDDPAAVDPITWFHDEDLDGYGDPDVAVAACDPPDFDWVANGDDCALLDEDIHPHAGEVCDGVDNDCTGLADDGLGTCPCLVEHDDAGKPYQFCRSNRTYPQAKATCDAVPGYHLLTIDDVDENLWAATTAEVVSTELSTLKSWWIGYTDPDGDQVYTWDYPSSGAFENWAGGTVPSTACVVLNGRTNNPIWNGANCPDAFYWAICEWDD